MNLVVNDHLVITVGVWAKQNSFCCKLHGYPPVLMPQPPIDLHIDTTRSAPPMTTEQYSQIMALLQNGRTSLFANLAGKLFFLQSSLFNRLWIVDTGAANHMIYFQAKQIFSNFKPVRLPNADLVPVVGAYDLQLSPSLQLQNVLCVPSFTRFIIH